MDHSATAHQIEETEVTPVKGAAQPVVINQAEPAGNEDAYEQPREIDLFNEGGSGETTFDQKSKKAFLEWSVPGEWNIGGNGGGALYQASKSEKAQQSDEDRLDFIAEMFERAEHAKKWDEKLHDFGNQKLTGAQINEIYDWFSKEENQEKIREKLRAEGKTEQEIKETFEKLEERRRLWEKMRLGMASQAEIDRYNHLGQNADVINAEADIAQAAGVDAEAKNVRNAHLLSAEDNEFKRSLSAQQSVNVQPQPKETSFGYQQFPTAANAGVDFSNAAAGIVKEDPKQERALPAPKVAASVATADIGLV